MNGRNYVKLLNRKKKSGISDNFTTVNTPQSKKSHKSRRRRLKDKKAKASKSSSRSIDKDKSDSIPVTIDEPKTFAPTKILKRPKVKSSLVTIRSNLSQLSQKQDSSKNVNLSPKNQKILSILSGGHSLSQFSKSAGSSPPIKLQKRTVSPTNGRLLMQSVSNKTSVIKSATIKSPPGLPPGIPSGLPPGFSRQKILQTNLNRNNKLGRTQNNDSKLRKEWNDKCDAYMKMLDGIDTNSIYENIIQHQSLTLEIPTAINLGIFSKSIWNDSENEHVYDDGWDKVLNRTRNKVSNPYSKEVYYSNNPSLNF